MRTRIDAVAKTPLDAARRFHTDFYGTARGEVAVVGDFDAKQIEVLVNELFTDYRSKAPYARLDREYREVKPARLAIDTPEKENAFIRARIDFPLRDDDPDAPALVFANEIFGGGAGTVEPSDGAAAAEGRHQLRRRDWLDARLALQDCRHGHSAH